MLDCAIITIGKFVDPDNAFIEQALDTFPHIRNLCVLRSPANELWSHVTNNLNANKEADRIQQQKLHTTTCAHNMPKNLPTQQSCSELICQTHPNHTH